MCCFEIPTFLAEGLSLDTPFHLGSIVNAIVEPGMNAATIKTKLRGFSPQANYTDQATAACRRS
jgi:hypothetical protein